LICSLDNGESSVFTLNTFVVSCAAGSKGDPRISCAETCFEFATARPTGETHKLRRIRPCEAYGFTVELGVYRLTDVDLRGFDGDEAYESRPLLQVKCHGLSAKQQRMGWRRHTVLMGDMVEEITTSFTLLSTPAVH
jgi:hypothetical protein